MAKSTKFLLWTGALIIIAVLCIFGYKYFPGRAKINSNLTDAKITIDGKELSKNSVWLKPGKHTAEAFKEDYLTSTIVFVVKPLVRANIELKLQKFTSLSPVTISDKPEDFKIDELASAKVQSAGSSKYIYLDEEQKAIFEFSDNKSTKIMDLPFLSTETVLKSKWSTEQKLLFVRSFKDDTYASRLITVADKSIKDMGADILDVAFKGAEYFTLNKSGNNSVILFAGKQITKIAEAKNNLEFDGNNLYIYNTVVDDHSNNIFYCPATSNCQKVNLSGDITNLFASGSHAVAITLSDSYSLYDITAGKSNLVDSNVAPLGSWLSNNFYYLKNGDTCAIKKYDFSFSNSIYQNSNICGIDDFSVAQDELFYRQAFSAYQLDLK